MTSCDVAIIGGGLAGLAAAIRCRWIKGHGAVPLRAVVVEPGTLGGLAAWRGCFLTGPGFYLREDELVSRLVADVERFEIPVVRRRAVGVEASGERDLRWRIRLDDGESLAARAVIVATGLRRQGGEAKLFGKGVHLTFMGYDHLHRLFAGIPRRHGTARPVLVVGNARTALLAPLFDRLRVELGVDWRFLLETTDASATAALGGPAAVRLGHYDDCRETDEGLTVGWRTPTGETAEEPFGAVIVDYNAFELNPSAELAGLPRDEAGFVTVDREGRTPTPFLYAAGDIAGGLAMALKAMQEGAAAGFAAYEDLYRLHFAAEPFLFAYRPQAVPVTPGMRTLPVWRRGDRVLPLIALDHWRRHCDDPPPAADGLDFGALAAAVGPEVAAARVDGWVERKLVTVHRPLIDGEAS